MENKIFILGIVSIGVVFIYGERGPSHCCFSLTMGANSILMEHQILWTQLQNK